MAQTGAMVCATRLASGMLAKRMDSTPPKRFAEVVTRQAATIKLAAAVVFLLVSLAALRGQGRAGPNANPLGLLLSMGPGVVFLVQFFQSLRRKVVKNLVVESDAVLADGYPLFRTSEIRSTVQQGPHVSVGRGVLRSKCTLAFDTAESAAAFVARISATPRGSADPEISLPSRMSQTRWLIITYGCAFGCLPILFIMAGLAELLPRPWSLAVIFAGVTAIGLAYFLVTTIPRVACGTDGIRISRRMRDEFISFAQIQNVEGAQLTAPFQRAGLFIRLHGGRVRHVGFGSDALTAKRVSAIATKATGLLGAYNKATVPPTQSGGAKSDLRWLEEVRAVATGGGTDHRRQDFDLEAIRQTLHNPRSEPIARAVAAFGVAHSDAGKSEVGAVATRTANANLRNAFELAVRLNAEEFSMVLEKLRASRPDPTILREPNHQ